MGRLKKCRCAEFVRRDCVNIPNPWRPQKIVKALSTTLVKKRVTLEHF